MLCHRAFGACIQGQQALSVGNSELQNAGQVPVQPACKLFEASVPSSTAKRCQRPKVLPGASSSFGTVLSKSLLSFHCSVQEPQKKEGEFSAFDLQVLPVL